MKTDSPALWDKDSNVSLKAEPSMLATADGGFGSPGESIPGVNSRLQTGGSSVRGFVNSREVDNN